MCYFYIIKSENWTPTKPIYKLQEKQPMDYDNVERWYNIGITPIRDYINHSNTYPRITATIKPYMNT